MCRTGRPSATPRPKRRGCGICRRIPSSRQVFKFFAKWIALHFEVRHFACYRLAVTRVRGTISRLLPARARSDSMRQYRVVRLPFTRSSESSVLEGKRYQGPSLQIAIEYGSNKTRGHNIQSCILSRYYYRNLSGRCTSVPARISCAVLWPGE
jgi:hypothetical protein